MSTLRPLLSHPTQRPKRRFAAKAFLSKPSVGGTVHQCASPRQAIFSQGNPSDAVYYIQTGKVTLSAVSKQEKDATIALLNCGDFLGEGCIASDQSVHEETATAITCCSLLRIEKNYSLRTPSLSFCFRYRTTVRKVCAGGNIELTELSLFAQMLQHRGLSCLVQPANLAINRNLAPR